MTTDNPNVFSRPEPLQLPEAFQQHLLSFRQRVWIIKTVEAVSGALVGVVLAYLLVFILDRFIDTPMWGRLAILAVAACALATVPLLLHRWIWCHRRMEQLARLISRQYPSLGDSMLGIIELVRSDGEASRSRALCKAAIAQVSSEALERDFSGAVPTPRHRQWLTTAAVALAITAAVGLSVPRAAMNASLRFFFPWSNVDRYTFADLKPLPAEVVVPHGEPATILVSLNPDSQWKPAAGKLTIGQQSPLKAPLEGDKYEFEIPGQITKAGLDVSVGDAQQRIAISPMHRPDLVSITALIELPEYLKRTAPLKKDLRGGQLASVKGSQVTLVASANRDLATATLDAQPVSVTGPELTTSPIKIDESRKLTLSWNDKFNLSAKEPLSVSLTAREDEGPILSCEGLPRQKVILVDEVINFKVHAQDDFGVKQIGITWTGLPDADASRRPETPASGDRLLSPGGPEQDSLAASGTFSAKSLGIEPQSVEVRLYAEDYFPGRSRVISPAYVLHILSPEDHAIWLTEQLAKWHRLALEVRDREQQLHATNQELRLLSPEELDTPEIRKRLETQSNAERANGRRLTSLVGSGEDLVRQAMRNPEFGVGHLEKWAEMLLILKDIAGNRMPSVADMLKQSAQAPLPSQSLGQKSAPSAGRLLDMRASSDKPGEQKPNSTPPKPGIADRESSQRPPGDNTSQDPPKESKPGSGGLRLPKTTVVGAPKKGGAANKNAPPAESLDEAVQLQQDLLAEFDKISDELNKVLANLEGSTLVKRLKGASRQQLTVASQLIKLVDVAFGSGKSVPAEAKGKLAELSTAESKASTTLSNIMDDMSAYFERRQFQRFKVVLDEMRVEDPIGSLTRLSTDVPTETGLSVAQAEYWADTFDRWADNLVDPACAGKCNGCKSKGSLPPSIVLEAMRILEAEMNLREETRVTQQARRGLEPSLYQEQAAAQSQTQEALAVRTAALAVRIREIPDGEADFAYEINLMGKVETVMQEARDILATPETGPTAIAAETEAIELLLSSKKINPKSRGGRGGSTPGGGGGGDTTQAALALLGSGINENEVREDRGIAQSTGEQPNSLPEEFRAGLDEYFNRLEELRGTP